MAVLLSFSLLLKHVILVFYGRVYYCYLLPSFSFRWKFLCFGRGWYFDIRKWIPRELLNYMYFLFVIYWQITASDNSFIEESVSSASRRSSATSGDTLLVEPSRGGSPVFPDSEISYESWADARWFARRMGDFSTRSSSSAGSADGDDSPSSFRSRTSSVISLPPLGLPLEDSEYTG